MKATAKRIGWGAMIVLAALGLVGCGGAAEAEPITIGLNLEISGDIPKVGEHSREAAELFVETINAAGGVLVGDERRTLALDLADNGGAADGATTCLLYTSRCV